MMTLEEIRNAKINPIIAREAHDQSAKRLSDLLEVKNTFEQKAFILFNGYITATLALFGVAGAIFNTHGLTSLVAALGITGICFTIGAIFFVLALIDKTYGTLGSSPDMWLESGKIDGPDSVLPLMLAYITFYYQERINVSRNSNAKKAIRIRTGIILGAIAPFALLATFFIFFIF